MPKNSCQGNYYLPVSRDASRGMKVSAPERLREGRILEWKALRSAGLLGDAVVELGEVDGEPLVGSLADPLDLVLRLDLPDGPSAVHADAPDVHGHLHAGGGGSRVGPVAERPDAPLPRVHVGGHRLGAG